MAFKYCIRLPGIAVIMLLLVAAFPASHTFGQVPLLPPLSGYSQGKGVCKDLAIGIASEHWRVRKGDVFEVSAVQPTVEDLDLDYSWSVSNGKIVAGQGSSKVEVKAGDAKTPGFTNVTGMVKETLLVSRLTDGVRCSVEASTSTMVGRERERNSFGQVTALVLNKGELRLPCPSGQAPVEGQSVATDLIVEVSTVAEDTENDVVTYSYGVSGGRIVGMGAKVRWDLTGAAPGVYTIHAGVDDGFGIFGKTQSRTISVTACKLK